jgi:LacI family transcriptional regulator
MIATVTRLGSVPCMQPDLSGFSCQTPSCPAFGKKGQGNLRVDSYYGKSKTLRMLYCKICRRRFSERKGTTLWGSQLPPETVARIYECLDQRRGTRETARLLGINRNTVDHYKKRRLRRRPRKRGPGKAGGDSRPSRPA